VLSKSDLEALRAAGIITAEQVKMAEDYLNNRQVATPRFDTIHFAYYFGALICIAAMTWLITLGWENFGGGGLALIGIIYATLFTLCGNYLWRQPDFKIPGGLLFTIAVSMTPLIIYGLQRETGFWIQGDPSNYNNYHIWIRGSWALMSVSTVVVASLYLWKFPFVFLTFPLSVALWYLSMDLTPLLFGAETFTWDDRKWVSLWFGLAIILVAYFLDRKTKEDYSFWLYLFGILAFWGGLSLMNSNSELSKFIYCGINIGLMLLALFLNRRTFMVFGALGVAGYLGHLSYRVFKDSMLFPIVLVLLGLSIIYGGVQLQKNFKKVEAWLEASLPTWLNDLRPMRRSGPAA
jgi:hypothetical protein